MSYWLVKTEPEEYSFDALLQDQVASWDGIRNYQARNYLNEMQVGDRVVVYHSGEDKEIRGFGEIVRAAYPDPTADGGNWVAVDVKALVPAGRPLGLEEIRNTHGIGVMPLVTQPRLSVHPVSEEQWNALLKYTKTTV